MDSFVIRNFNSVKSLKYQHRSFPRITDVFRYVEICVVVSALLWFFSTKPQFNLNLGFFQDVCQFLLSSRFVFVVGNAIVLTLFVKSGQFSGENSEENSSSSSSTGDVVYDEFVKNSKKIRHQTYINQETPIPPETSSVNQEEEASVLEAPPAATLLPEEEKEEEELEDEILTEKTVTKHLAKPNSNAVAAKTKTYKRSKSEYPKREKAEEAGRELRRSKTEKSKEEMSNEEFQRTIEDFIARQVKFIREESMAVVLQK